MNSPPNTEEHGLQLTNVLCVAAVRTPVTGRCRKYAVRPVRKQQAVYVCTLHCVRRQHIRLVLRHEDLHDFIADII
jgi:hypothetical protein